VQLNEHLEHEDGAVRAMAEQAAKSAERNLRKVHRVEKEFQELLSQLRAEFDAAIAKERKPAP